MDLNLNKNQKTNKMNKKDYNCHISYFNKKYLIFINSKSNGIKELLLF